jgi:putative peptide zinc metalloprotease protein
MPKLRSDLTYSSHRDSDGDEIVVINDPVAGKYFRVSSYEMDFLKTLSGDLSVEDAREWHRKRGRYYDPEDTRLIVGKAAQYGLLLGTQYSSADYQFHAKQRLEQAGRVRRLSQIYYLFLPLLNPDAFLERTLKYFRLFYNRWTLLFFIALIPGAVFLVIDGLPRLGSAYLFFFNVTNLIYLWITIALSKVVHEFSHAYVAKRYGLRVPLMGVGFILFFPVLYCDTSDAWKLADRRPRMAIAGAGILSEIAMAIISVYIWYFSRPGMVNSIAFYLMTYSLVSTVLFNGNPLMKFDGYYIFMDFIRKPNLASKALGYVKYLWMNGVLGLSGWMSTAADRTETSLFFSMGPRYLSTESFLSGES